MISKKGQATRKFQEILLDGNFFKLALGEDSGYGGKIPAVQRAFLAESCPL